MKTAILTGATGFIGFALLTELIQSGVSVTALYRPDSPRLARLEGMPNVRAIEADLNNPDGIRGINGLGGCEVFYHLAWEGERNNFEQQYANVRMSLNCLRLASEMGCKRFICTGSQAEYGNVSSVITEDTALCPVTSYGACKAAAYHLTGDLAKRLNIEHAWVRVFSAYGPNDNPHTLVIRLIRDLRSKGGANLASDGRHIWSYLFEKDAARALHLLGAAAHVNGPYNLASADIRPLREFVEELRGIVAPDSSVSYGSERDGVNLNVALDKILYAIGEFEYTSFADGIRETMSGFK